MKNELFNTGWEFCKKPLGTSLTAVCRDNSFTPNLREIYITCFRRLHTTYIMEKACGQNNRRMKERGRSAVRKSR